jgi:hypothetical protein
MGEKVLIILNKTSEGPGLVEEVLIERGIKYSVTDLVCFFL